MITVTKKHAGFGDVVWEYVGTVDAADTMRGTHPRAVFTSFYYGVPRAETEGFGTTTWDVWVPRGRPGYSSARITRWQASCPHRFHDDALAVLTRWEAECERRIWTSSGGSR